MKPLPHGLLYGGQLHVHMEKPRAPARYPEMGLQAVIRDTVKPRDFRTAHVDGRSVRLAVIDRGKNPLT
jgi:hypothetical protein